MAENNTASTANDVRSFQPGNKIGFQPGQSGNPGGKPKKLAELVDLARSLAPDAIKALHEIAVNGRSEKCRIVAAVALLDRGFGKPKIVESQADRPILHRIEKIIVQERQDSFGPYTPPSLDDVGFRVVEERVALRAPKQEEEKPKLPIGLPL
jgi:Family of unknown function (DUF5681)